MSPEEQHDLGVMKLAQMETKIKTFDLMVMLAHPDTVLEHCGYRNGLGDALTRCLADGQKALRKLEQAHIKKYPDL